MRLSFAASVVSISLFVSGSAAAAPFVPKILEPESYKDIRYGLDEMRTNIESVQCGGWTDLSDASVVPNTGPPSCFPRLVCVPGINSCEGFTGYTHMKNPDGSVPVCLSNTDAVGGQWDYLLMHELVHVKQFCGKAPGTPLYTTRAECCQLEREAYSVQCNAEAADGLFDNPINGIQLTTDSCIAYGTNKVSCSAFGPNPCSNDVFPPGFGVAYTAAITTSPRNSCDEITTNPSPRVQSLLDSIQRISDGSPSTVVGYVPTPRFTAVNPDGSEDTVALPGRKNINPLGDAAGGLGQRGAFEYPDSALGFMSACDPVYTKTMDEPALGGVGIKIHDRGNISLDGPARVVEINPMKWCTRDNDMEKATPVYCGWLFNALRQMGPALDAADARPKIGNPLCQVPKKFCFDYTSECRGQGCRTTAGPYFEQRPPECKEVVQPDGSVKVVITKQEEIIVSQASFYRHYAGNFYEAEITVTVPGEDNVWNVRAECYEYYKEKNLTGTTFDPKEDVTSQADEQCEFVIKTDGYQTPRKPEWREGDGHSQKEKVRADADIVEEPLRSPRNVPEPWVADMDTNLAMIDIRKLKVLQAGFDDPTDVTALLGTLITTRQTGSKSTPKNAHTDQFDDTAERKMAEYLEAQQRELLKMTADPQTRLIMPARFLVGLADDDPLFQYVQHTVSRSDGTVEITLKAGLEDIGNVLKSFQRVFVAPTQEVRIPVLVPLVSVTEVDARIADWRLWKQNTVQRAATVRDLAEDAIDPAKRAELLAEAAALDAAALKVDPLIAKLMQYRGREEEIRLMRGALLSYLEKFFDSQKQIREYFADWYQKNSALLTEAGKRAEQRKELKRIWRLLQRSMLQADACQLLWCSNQRYSLPVYSLLDNWWGDGESGDKRDPNYQPPQSLTDLNYVPQKDQVFDFSDVKFSPEPWLIPTLWPVQVRIKLPLPPDVGVEPPSVADFPDLPPVPDDTVFDSLPVPTVDLPDKPLIVPPVPDDLEPAKEILRAFRFIIDGTATADQINEEAALARGESIDTGNGDFPLDRGNMRGTYCRFPPSILIPPDAKDKKYFSDPAAYDRSDPSDMFGNPAKIIHIENELRERLARLFSRWMPQREEDYAGRVVRLMEKPPEDMPPECHEDIICYLLPPEMRRMTTWQWFMPDVRGGDFTSVGDDLRARTLPATEALNPYYGANRTTLQRLFPLLDLPITTKLTVPRTTP